VIPAYLYCLIYVAGLDTLCARVVRWVPNSIIKGVFMSFDRVPPGKDLPQDFNVIIELPAQSDPVKYEADKELGLLVVDRFISTGMRYPANYGFIPQTLSGDGDPVDVLVITPFPLLAGSVVRAPSACCR
jgi:inorganic pyrophosphatase